jgi:hypothetical protein
MLDDLSSQVCPGMLDWSFDTMIYRDMVDLVLEIGMDSRSVPHIRCKSGCFAELIAADIDYQGAQLPDGVFNSYDIAVPAVLWRTEPVL